MRWIVTILLCLSLGTSAQQSYKVDVQNTPLKEVLEDLTQRYRLKISYDANRVKDHLITKKITTFSEADLLSELFSDLPFKIQLSSGIYLIIPKKFQAPPKQEFVQGRVTKNESGEPLAYAHVQINDEGTTTTEQGYFTLPFPKDSAFLKISHLGYKPFSRRFLPDSKNNFDFSLVEDTEVLQEVVLTSAYYRDKSIRPSVARLNPSTISSLPSLGTVDLFKSIQLLPGIQATDETSSGLVVRGGSSHQNLVLLDGFTLYHLDHFFGIFSTFNPNTISNVEVYKGGFGAEFGGRISSVVDVTGKSGSRDSLKAGFGLNLLSFDGYIEAPISSKSSLLVGYRRSFMDVIQTKLFKNFLSSNRIDAVSSLEPDFEDAFELDPSFYFYDFTAKWRYRPTKSSVVDVNVYTSEDFYKGTLLLQDETDFSSFRVADESNWSNIGTSVNWDQYFTPKWFSSISLGISSYSNEASFSSSETFGIDLLNESDNLTLQADTTISYLEYAKYNEVGDMSLKIQQELIVDDKNSLIVGTEFNALATNFEFNFFENVVDGYNQRAKLISFYAEHHLKLNRFQAEIGFRYVNYQPTKTEMMEQRLSASYQLTPILRVKGSWSKHNQFMNRLSLTPFGNSDQFYWVLADEEFVYPIQQSRHAILGIELFKNNWVFDFEYYDKRSLGILEPNYDLFISDATIDDIEIFNSFNSGQNQSNGLDFFAKYRTKKFTSWLSYSFSKSYNQFNGINRNQAYPSLQDQRHEINLVAMYKLNKWEFSSVFIYGSGKPYTPFGVIDDEQVLYDINRINSRRLPDYHRLDVSAKYNFELGKTSSQAGVTLFNLYAQKNIRSRRYAFRYDFDQAEGNVSDTSEGFLKVIKLDSRLLGFTPNFFVRFNF